MKQISETNEMRMTILTKEVGGKQFRITVKGDQRQYEYTHTCDDRILHKSKSSVPIEMFVNAIQKDGFELIFFSKEGE